MLLVLSTECFFSFDIFEIESEVFWVFKAFWVCWRFMRCLGLNFGIYNSETCVFLSSFAANDCGTNISHFSGHCVAS